MLMTVVAIILMAPPLMSTTPQITIFKLLEVGFKDSVAEMITSKLQSELIATGKYKVLEREKVPDILKEQGFQQNGCTSSE
jgi:curli biogenesis system outer membrane secretion channel CsgG